MRTREEIEKTKSGDWNLQRIIIELLLDIRDLLAPKDT